VQAGSASSLVVGRMRPSVARSQTHGTADLGLMNAGEAQVRPESDQRRQGVGYNSSQDITKGQPPGDII